MPESAYDLHDAIATIEDYHPLDVECAAAALCLLRGIRERYPSLRYLVDGDGGDENLKAYPLEDSDLTLSSVLRNPLLYQEGWGIDAIKHSLVYSGGLSRGYVRTFAPAAALRVHGVLAVLEPAGDCRGGRDSVRDSAGRDPTRLMTLKQDVVRGGGAGGDRRRHAGARQAALPGRRAGDAAHAGHQGVVPAGVRTAVAGATARGRRRREHAPVRQRNERARTVSHPDGAAGRDRFVLDLRGPKAVLDPHRAYAAVWEEERDEAGAPRAPRPSSS